MKDLLMRQKWTKTDHTGIYRKDDRLKVRATAKDQTGKMRQRERTLPEGADLTDAAEMRQQLKGEIRGETQPTVDSRSITHFAAQWVARRVETGRWSGRTSASRKQYLRDQILPVIGHVQVDRLGREHIREWIDYADSAVKTHHPDGRPLAKPVRYGHKSVRSWWSLLRQLVKGLYLEGHVDMRFVEWCRDQPGPSGDKSKRREMRTLTRTQLNALVDTAEEVMHASRFAEVITLARTGMRAGELYGLDWDHIDYDKQTITIEQSYSKNRLGPTKTGKTRVAPVSRRVLDAIQAHRKRLKRLENVGLFKGITFPANNGKRRGSTSGIKKMIRKATDQLGIDVDVGPQVIRASVVTILKNAGAHKKQIKALVGHETDEMHDHYTRPPTSEVRQVSALLGG